MKKAYVCNLLEEIETEAVVNGNEIEVVLKPYEVVTVLLAGAVPTQGSDSVAGHEIMRHEAKRRLRQGDNKAILYGGFIDKECCQGRGCTEKWQF